MSLDAPPEAFALQAFMDGCVAEVRLNDVPLDTARLRRTQATIHATPWVVDGENVLSLHITDTRITETRVADGRVGDDDEAGPIQADARIVGGAFGTIHDPERDPTFAELRWAPTESEARAVPRRLATTFRVAGRPRWAWQDAPLLDLVADRPRVLAFVAELYAAFERGDGSAIARTLPTLFRESVHFGPNGRALSGGFVASIARLTAEPGYCLLPYAPDEVVLDPIADGRVVRILKADGAPLLRSGLSMQKAFSFPFNVAVLGGALELVRLG